MRAKQTQFIKLAGAAVLTKRLDIGENSASARNLCRPKLVHRSAGGPIEFTSRGRCNGLFPGRAKIPLCAPARGVRRGLRSYGGQGGRPVEER